MVFLNCTLHPLLRQPFKNSYRCFEILCHYILNILCNSLNMFLIDTYIPWVWECFHIHLFPLLYSIMFLSYLKNHVLIPCILVYLNCYMELCFWKSLMVTHVVYSTVVEYTIFSLFCWCKFRMFLIFYYYNVAINILKHD